MTDLPLHPAIVHLPLGLSMVMPFLSGGILLAWTRGWLPRKTWYLAAALQLVVAVGGFASGNTGEQDEHEVEERVGHDLLHEHEELADKFIVLNAGLLLVFIGAAVLRNEKIARGLAGVGTVGSLGALILGTQVGHAGGMLVHTPEARAGTAGNDHPTDE